jgi:hypothetical protein
VQAIEALVRVIARAGEPLWHPDPDHELPPQIEEELEHYIDESHATALAILPLEKPRPTPVVKPGGVDATAIARAEAAPRSVPEPIGALVAEWFQSAALDAGRRARVDLVAEHGRSALANALTHTSLPLYPLLDLAGKSKVLTTARNLPRTVLAGVAALAAVAAQGRVPAAHRHRRRRRAAGAGPRAWRGGPPGPAARHAAQHRARRCPDRRHGPQGRLQRAARGDGAQPEEREAHRRGAESALR